MFLLDEFLVDVRVDLRGADVGVAEELLQYAQVHAGLQAVRGEAVAEGMRRDLLGEVHGVLLHDFPGSHAGHGLAPGIENDVVRSRVGEGAAFLDPGL